MTCTGSASGRAGGSLLAGLDIIKEIPTYRQQVKREWGVDFDVRVGINTGLVVVGEVGSDAVLREAMGPDLYEAFARAKRAEWDLYRTHVTDWEVETYLQTA